VEWGTLADFFLLLNSQCLHSHLTLYKLYYTLQSCLDYWTAKSSCSSHSFGEMASSSRSTLGETDNDDLGGDEGVFDC